MIRKYVVFPLLIAFLFSVITVFVNETNPQRSSYSYNLNILDCNNIEPLKGCRHEIGHKMDDDLGMPSQSIEFNSAMQAHVLVEMSTLEVPDDTAILISLYPDRDPREMYAALYSSVDGDIARLPVALRRFFSTDPSYQRLYDCLAQIGFNACGLSFSNLKGQ